VADWLDLHIQSRTQETADIIAFDLVSPDGTTLPPFDAGAHLDVEVMPGVTRQYSLCNPPHETDRYTIAVLRDPASRGGSIALQDRFAQGDSLRVSPPRNLFPLQPAPHSLLLAGGIGVTPLLAMAETLSRAQAPFTLHYCARTPARAAFRPRLAAAPYAPHVHWHFDDGAPEQRLDPHGLLAAAPPGTHAYVCGPGGYIDWIVAAAEATGFPLERLHREYFSAAPIDTDGDRPFQLRLARSGLTVEVAATETAAAALARHGIELPISCEQGICGTCITPVLEGEPDHRDMLMLDGNEEFTPCCSRALSPVLVIDL
jgi:vanillate monooxygenase ferredoxin subunit